jgi:hypothetical protein
MMMMGSNKRKRGVNLHLEAWQLQRGELPMKKAI